MSLLSFPRYSATHFGAAIGRFLNGEFGSLDQVDPHLAATLYAADRFESKEMLTQAIAENDVVICDRYVPSNIAHQGGRKTGEARTALQNWISHVEYEVFRLPRADLIVHLDLPAETAQELIARKAARDYTDRKADLQEADRKYLAAVREAYLELSESESGWKMVSLLDGEKLRSIEEIGDKIAALVVSALDDL